MRIFYVCRRVPFPPDRGDKIAAYNTIVHLAARHEIHVFCIGDGVQDLSNISGLRAYAKSVTAAPVGGLKIKLRAFRALLTGAPLSVAALSEAALHRAMQSKFAELRPDLVIVYSCNVAQFAEHPADVPRIVHFGDLDSLKWRMYADQSRPPLRWIYALEARRLLGYERHIARTFSHSLVHTDAEKRDFKRLIPGAPVSVVGNGVDLAYFRSGGVTKRPASLVFTGVMDYRPNVEAVIWFCDQMLPAIQAEIPQASFTICGSRPAPAVRRLAARRGVTVTGWVPDPRPYLDRAELFVAPLRMARGVQNKMLEALAMGLPCVASTVASRGTGLADGEGILVADDPREFAGRVVDLLLDGTRRADLARRARTAAETNYRWEKQLSHLDQIIAAVWRPCGGRRSNPPVRPPPSCHQTSRS
jgi:sugar transferase (PEP-CTERM/EpsH1 system associated)